MIHQNPPESLRAESPHEATTLHQAVEAAFGVDGAMARADARYAQREVQRRLALAVVDAIDGRKPLVAEAGTGVGKTYAYLVPVLLSGCRALVSTATKSLQDQLFLRDIPRLCRALNVPISVALLKGRGSYLCTHRLKQARQTAQLPDRWAVRTLAKIEQWSHTTRTGDLAELDGLDERSSVIPLVTSTRENCLGSECPDFKACHVVRARREAMSADLVVINHHLFFADMALRDTGVAELLPSVEVAIFDEAHQLSDAGVQFLGSTLGTGQMLDFARDMLALGLQQARGLQPWQELAQHCEHAARELRLCCAGPVREVRASIKLRWEDRATRPAFLAGLADWGEAAREAVAALTVVNEISVEFPKLIERAQHLLDLSDRFARPAALGHVRWIDLTAHAARLVESPLDISEALSEQMGVAPKAWVFTSATLGDDDALSWFTDSAGLGHARCLRVGSPFPYAEHARLYVPRRFPKPNDSAHPDAVALLAARCARVLGGRTFVLTTTLRALKAIGEALRQQFDADGLSIEVLLQGQSPKRQLMQQFLSSPAAVLVGSQSFWEGIDVPGDALQCVLIDKLPFPPPSDPLVEARVARLEAQGRNPFTDYFVAEAVVSLKQGAGRLIRSETDRGLLVVCDPRMASMNYGQRLREALPPMGWLSSEEEALTWLQELSAVRDSAW